MPVNAEEPPPNNPGFPASAGLKLGDTAMMRRGGDEIGLRYGRAATDILDLDLFKK